MNPRLFFEKLTKRMMRAGETLAEAGTRLNQQIMSGERDMPRPTKRTGQYTRPKFAARLRREAQQRTKAARREQQRKGVYGRAQA